MELEEIVRYRSKLEQRKGRRNHVVEQMGEAKDKLQEVTSYLDTIDQAKTILQRAAKLTQEQLEYHISEIVSLALYTIFNDPYEFKLRFEERRGKTEADLLFVRNGDEFDPISASGGGAVDVASFALRVALWRLQNPRSRNTLVLDEPFRFLSKGLLPQASALLKKLSEKLQLQFVIVTHSLDLIEEADKVFEIENKDGISKVEEVAK